MCASVDGPQRDQQGGCERGCPTRIYRVRRRPTGGRPDRGRTKGPGPPYQGPDCFRTIASLASVTSDRSHAPPARGPPGSPPDVHDPLRSDLAYLGDRRAAHRSRPQPGCRPPLGLRFASVEPESRCALRATTIVPSRPGDLPPGLVASGIDQPGSIRPRRMATAAASTRPDTPSLDRILPTWTPTVF